VEDNNAVEEEEDDNDPPVEPFTHYHPPSLDDITATFSKMSVKPSASSGPFNLGFQFPYLQYTYIEAGRRHCSIDFLVCGLSKKDFRLNVVNGSELHVGVVTPRFFVETHRLQMVHRDDRRFNDDTNKATALEELVGKITNDLSDEEPLIGPAQVVKLPGKYEDDIVKWEIQSFFNDDKKLKKKLGGIQPLFFVLSVDLLSTEKIKSIKKKGGMRIFGSPVKPKSADDWDSSDEEAEKENNKVKRKNRPKGEDEMEEEEEDNN